MKINGRLLLLAVVTGLFMRIWSETGARSGSDRVAVSRPTPAAVSLPQPVVETSVSPEEPDLQVTAAVPSIDLSLQHEEWTPHSAPISLPQGLSAGTWRVVDDTGRVARLELPVGQFPVHQQQQTEFHVTTIDGQRWYFIRLNSPERIASGQPVLEAASTPAPPPACDESPVTVDAGNPGNPLAGGEVVVVLDTVPSTGVEKVAPPSDPTCQADASSELAPVPVMAEPLHAPPAMADWRPQSPPDPQPETTLETSGGITNRKFDFRGYGAEETVTNAPTADVTPAGSVPQGVAELTPERPTEVDMPEEA
ncbi:MAG: hypothetical protein ACK6D3_19520 [Planctomycetaceae bacterium]|jgi:hypothetical protein